MENKRPFTGWFVELIANLRFFTRIPLPKIIPREGEWVTPNFSYPLLNLPIISLTLSIPAILLLLVLTFTELPPLVVATLVIFTICWLTGGLHEDGLADSADGLFGGNSPESRLAIMKDSRIGSYGVMALILSFSLRIYLFSEIIIEFYNFYACYILIGAVTISRTLMLIPWVFLKPAKVNSLSTKFGSPNFLIFIFILFNSFLLNAPLMYVFTFSGFMLAFAMSLWISFWVCFIANKRIKGYTGDILGATQQLSEIAFLIGFLHIY